MDPLIFRSLLAIDTNTNLPISTNYILSTDGFGNISWQNSLNNLSSYSEVIGYLPSTINTLNTFLYNISTGVLPGSLSTPSLTSTVDGLGTIGYISSQALFSTVTTLGSLGYLSSAFFGSTINGLGTYGYVSTLSLTSTFNGLGTGGYVSSLSLTSSLEGLGTLAYVSTAGLRSTVEGLGSVGYVSGATFIYALNNLGSVYVSTASLQSTTSGLNSTMISSVTSILQNNTNFYLNKANALVIAGSNVNVIISSLSTGYFYDTFNNSSVKYVGCNGNLAGFCNNSDLFISSLDLQLNSFSSFINSKSQITLDLYPNILLPSLDPNWIPKLLHVSTVVAYSNRFVQTHNTKYIIQNNNYSNIFQQPIKLNMYGNDIGANYSNKYQVMHRFMNIINFGGSGGISSSNVTLAFDSTTSYYLSVQNITP